MSINKVTFVETQNYDYEYEKYFIFDNVKIKGGRLIPWIHTYLQLKPLTSR